MPVEAAVAAGTRDYSPPDELLRRVTATQGVVERRTNDSNSSNYYLGRAGIELSLTATIWT